MSAPKVWASLPRVDNRWPADQKVFVKAVPVVEEWAQADLVVVECNSLAAVKSFARGCVVAEKAISALADIRGTDG